MGVLDHLHVVRYLDVALLERPEVKEAGEAVAVRRAYRGPFGAVEDALELHEEALLVLQPWFALVRHRRHRRHYARAPVLSTLSMPEISIFCTSTPISREFEAASTVHEPECETLKFQPRTRSRCLSLSPSSTWCASISTTQHNTLFDNDAAMSTHQVGLVLLGSCQPKAVIRDLQQVAEQSPYQQSPWVPQPTTRRDKHKTQCASNEPARRARGTAPTDQRGLGVATEHEPPNARLLLVLSQRQTPIELLVCREPEIMVHRPADL